MLTGSHGRLRDWLLFAAAALTPAFAVGILGLRALAAEDEAVRRQARSSLEAAAERTARELQQALSAGALALGGASLDLDPARAVASLRALAPPFTEPVVLARDRSLLAPPAPRALDPVPSECGALAAALAAKGEASGRAKARASFLARCAEARSATGRWLWPVVALDPASRDAAADVPAWLLTHAGVLSEPEREATQADVRASTTLDESARGRATDALAVHASRRGELQAALGEAEALAAMHRGPDSSGLVTWRGEASLGTLRSLPDARLAGFVTCSSSVAEALRSGGLGVPAELLAEVVQGPLSPADARPSALVAAVPLAPRLWLRLAPRDPRAVERSASRSRAALAATGLAATGLALGFAAVLFARMRAARRSSALRTDFVSAVSHELRTPIASVRMLAELLDEGRLEEGEHREVYEALAREARRLGETVDRLLGFSRMSAGRQAIERAVGSVAEVASGAIDTFEERFPEGPKVVRDLDPEAMAPIDAGQLRLALDNLLANARKYAPEGGPYEVRVWREKAAVALSVTDRGPGIARRDHRRIFEPFERADDRLSRATEGSGIGLSLVRHVARAHGGEATVTSVPGGGATFTLRVPTEAR